MKVYTVSRPKELEIAMAMFSEKLPGNKTVTVVVLFPALFARALLIPEISPTFNWEENFFLNFRFIYTRLSYIFSVLQDSKIKFKFSLSQNSIVNIYVLPYQKLNESGEK